MIIDILMYLGIGILMIATLIMGVMWEYAVDEIERIGAIRRLSATRRQKWKDLKRLNRG